MRIIHCLRAPVGGLFRHVLDLAAEQARLGHDVGIVADRNSEDALTAAKFALVAPVLTLGIHRVPMRREPGIGDMLAYRAVLATVRRLKPDIIHGHGAKGGAYARLAAWRLRASGSAIKVFYTPHGGTLHFDPKTLEGRIFFGLERVLRRTTDGVIFESAYAERMFSQRVSLRGVASRVIPNGLLRSDFQPIPPAVDAADFLFVGELRELKGVAVLLQALADIKRRRPVTAVLVGAGPDAEQFRRLAADLDLQRDVRFAGALPARTAFALGRIMIVPSFAESFPYVVLEAAAATIPMIATHVGGIPEIAAGTDWTLIPPRDAGRLAASMDATLNNLDDAYGVARRLNAKVAADYTVSRMAASILEFYR